MKKTFLLSVILLLFFASNSFSQSSNQINFIKKLKLNDKVSPLKKIEAAAGSASMGFNLGTAIIESQVGFAIGVFAELKAREISFVPQANYWSADEQNNFELAGLARFYLTQKGLIPYIDGGLGINFYNSDKTDFTKLSIIIGGGVELTKLGSASFSLLFDGKYKLIINDAGNLSCFILTAGMKFPF